MKKLRGQRSLYRGKKEAAGHGGGKKDCKGEEDAPGRIDVWEGRAYDALGVIACFPRPSSGDDLRVSGACMYLDIPPAGESIVDDVLR